MRLSVRIYRAACCNAFRKVLAAASTVELQYGVRRTGCSIEARATQPPMHPPRSSPQDGWKMCSVAHRPSGVGARNWRMKVSATIDQVALDLFSSEGAPSRQDPPLPDCVASPGTMSGFHPRRMPALRVACPASDGAPQRYREPLWRAFKAKRS